MKNEAITYRTKKQLSMTLKRLVENKPFSKITISELAEACSLNRKTFYYHFNDLHQLLKWTLEQEAVEILKEYGRMNNFTEAVKFSVNYIYKNKSFLAGVYKSIGNEQLAEFFRNDFREVILMAINMHENNLNVKINENFREFLSKFYANALAGQMIEILMGNTPETQQTISDYILFTLSISLSEVIKTTTRSN